MVRRGSGSRLESFLYGMRSLVVGSRRSRLYFGSPAEMLESDMRRVGYDMERALKDAKTEHGLGPSRPYDERVRGFDRGTYEAKRRFQQPRAGRKY